MMISINNCMQRSYSVEFPDNSPFPGGDDRSVPGMPPLDREFTGQPFTPSGLTATHGFDEFGVPTTSAPSISPDDFNPQQPHEPQFPSIRTGFPGESSRGGAGPRTIVPVTTDRNRGAHL